VSAYNEENILPTATNSGAGYFQPRRLGHVNLIVNNTEAAMEFYTDVVGLEEVYRVPAIGGGFLSNGNTHHDIAVIESSSSSGRGRAPGLNHLAFELETEVDLVKGYEASTADSLEFERTLDHDIAHSVYCADPDNNSCELYADVVKDWRNARSGIITKPKSKWWPGKTTPIAETMYDPNPEIRIVSAAVFHPLRTKHAALVVEDLNSSIVFYRERIGLELIIRGDEHAILGGTCGEKNLTLVQQGPKRGAGYHHVGMEVASEEELLNSVDKWKAMGGNLIRFVDSSVRMSAYLADPDGLLVQFFVDRADETKSWESMAPDVALWNG